MIEYDMDIVYKDAFMNSIDASLIKVHSDKKHKVNYNTIFNSAFFLLSNFNIKEGKKVKVDLFNNNYKYSYLAKKILSMDKDARVYALYVASTKVKNKDILWKEIKKSMDEDDLYLFDNVNTFNDYLVRKGFVDKSGNPSIDVYSKSVTSNYKDVASSLLTI